MLQFRLFRVPIRVETSFLLVGLLGWPAFTGLDIVAWIAAAFVAILLHELGHALTARAFGAKVAVTIHAFGGVTSWSTSGQISSGRRFGVAAAGSAVGIVVAATTLFAVVRAPVTSWSELIRLLGSSTGVFVSLPGLVQAFLLGFWWASFVWGLLNWLPIRALDGGHMLEALLNTLVPKRAASIARLVGIVTGVGAALVAVRFGQWLAAIVVVMMTLPELSSRAPGAPAPSAPQAATAAPAPEDEFPI